MSDDLVARLRNTPNWKREEYGNWKDAASVYDRAPFDAADALEREREAVYTLTESLKRAEAEREDLLQSIADITTQKCNAEAERDTLLKQIAAIRETFHGSPTGEVARLRAERDALLTAAEHGLSLMLAGRLDDQGNPVVPLRLYHRCEGCESALRLLQSMGKYPGAEPADDAKLREGKV
jgi:hypothetical protein